MERMDRRGWVCVGGCGTSGLPPKTVRRIAERVRKRAVVNALRQALTRSAGAARQRHTTEGRKTAPHDNDARDSGGRGTAGIRSVMATVRTLRPQLISFLTPQLRP